MKSKWNNALLQLLIIGGLTAGCASSSTAASPAESTKKKGGTAAMTTTSQNPVVVMETNKGKVEIELFKDKAPISVDNFLKYVDKHQYDGTIFHRVINDFMIQGGGFTPDMKEKPSDKPIKNEADNGVANTRGTLAMARTNVVDSATAQFFINVKDNTFLNHQDKSNFGYAVFGKVTTGMDVVDAIKAVKTGSKPPYDDVPVEAVIIKSIKRK